MRNRNFSASCLVLAVMAGAGCTARVSSVPFQASSAVRAKGKVAIEGVRYLPADQKKLKPNEFEFNKAGTVLFEISLADHLRRCVTRELEASGFRVEEGGAKLSIDITRYHLADKFTSLELYIEATWTLSVGEKSVSRPLRAARRHAFYGNQKKAEDMNAMASEQYEAFFSDPEVRALLRASADLVTP